jgi:hypothetical protein
MNPATTPPMNVTSSLMMTTDTNNSNTARETLWENRIWTATQTIMVAAMLWVGSTLLTLSNTVARIEERLSHAVLAQQVRDKLQDERIDNVSRQIDAMRFMVPMAPHPAQEARK